MHKGDRAADPARGDKISHYEVSRKIIIDWGKKKRRDILSRNQSYIERDG